MLTRYILALGALLSSSGCVWKLTLAAEIKCPRTAMVLVDTDETRATGMRAAKCTEPTSPVYACTPTASSSGTVSWSCDVAPPEWQPRVPRMASYEESEYASYQEAGSASVVGQAFLKTRGGDIKVAAGNDVYIAPATSYSDEYWNVTLNQGLLLEGKLDPRHAALIRSTVADGDGRFKAEGLAPGAYYLYTYISWEVPGKSGLRKTGGWAGAKVVLVSDVRTEVILKALN